MNICGKTEIKDLAPNADAYIRLALSSATRAVASLVEGQRTWSIECGRDDLRKARAGLSNAVNSLDYALENIDELCNE